MTKQNSHFDTCNDTITKAISYDSDGTFANVGANDNTCDSAYGNDNAIIATQPQRNNATNQPDPYTFPYGKIIFKDKLNIIAVVDGAYFLIVWNKRMEREHIAPTAYEFDGHLKRIAPNGERETVCDGLIRMIQDQGAFYAEYHTIRDGSRERKDPRNDSGIGLDQALYMLYHNAPLDRIKTIHVSTSKEPIKLEGNVAYDHSLQEIQDFYKTYFTLDYRIAAIRSDEYSDIWHGKGAVIRCEDNHILISCGEKIFFTDYDDGLFDLLKSIPSWEVKSGALRGGINDAERQNLKMSLSSIVGAYHNGLFDDTIINIREKLEDAKESFDKLRILYDHMTENKQNNFYYNLLALPKNVEDGKENPNNKLFNLRTRIKAPYFFFSVCDHSRKRF